MSKLFTAIVAVVAFYFIAPILGKVAWAIFTIIGGVFTLAFSIIQLTLAIALVWMLSMLFRRYIMKEEKRETTSIAQDLWRHWKKGKENRQARRQRNAKRHSM